jgi:hypothetical protein
MKAVSITKKEMTNNEMCKDEFPAEARKRGTIAISEIPTTGNAQDRWLRLDGYLNYYVGEENPDKLCT